ncbi:uncharacterized protein LOC127285308 [Leptopilina boulardi]|uniref:uncharacterized protein LOC127285308 n=1 Tax=Leptopilina boulardi TaxID=63433 RepID=UPI0021F53A51|nr:uncharacterized protein LOC127285308 [Leptopilina boulardi]
MHKYDGNRLDYSLPSPAEAAREELSQLIKEESHPAMKLIPNEASEKFNCSIKKLYASGRNFNSVIIRPTSCYVESEFGEVKHNILNNVHGSIRADKFFKIHFGALKAHALIASSEIGKVQINNRIKTKSKDLKPTEKIATRLSDFNENIEIDPGSLIESPKNQVNQEINSITGNQVISEVLPVNDKIFELPSFDENISAPIHHSTPINMESLNIQTNHDDEGLRLSPKLPNSDLFKYENWRNKGKVESEESSNPIIVSERIKRTLKIKERKPSKYFDRVQTSMSSKK